MLNQIDYPGLHVIAHALRAEAGEENPWMKSLTIIKALDAQGYLLVRQKTYNRKLHLARLWGGCIAFWFLDFIAWVLHHL